MKHLLTLVLVALQALALQAQTTTTRLLFIYAPNEKDGLHLAVHDGNRWTDCGQLCASDYGPWGSEKRMYHPSVTRAHDGTWRLVFQVNDQAPLLAAAYSRDLVNWRPQDYPLLSGPCRQPVVRANGDGTFDVYYRSSQGVRHTSASADFRHFTPDRPVGEVDETLWQRDTATVGGTRYEGQRFAVSMSDWQTIDRFLNDRRDDRRLSAERMHDDASLGRFRTSDGTLHATLNVDAARQKAISPDLIGIFFEDISYAADGGLYAELVQNRDFEYTARDHKGWDATTAWHSSRPIEIATTQPLHANNPHYAVLTTDTLWNEGWDGIAVTEGERYDFSMYMLTDGGKQTFDVRLVGHDGTVLAQGTVQAKGSGWQRCETVLTAKKTDKTARLMLFPRRSVRVGIDMVSLFPQQTFMGRKNGLRRDLAQVIADLHPRFVRFPGGCMSHGQGLDNIYHWHETIGPLYARKPDFNIWHYHQTRGLGFYEYFQFCEDIGAEPLPVLAAGVPCQNSQANAQGIGGQQGGIAMDQMQAYIQELLNLIEWANGDPKTSEWARRRAEAGHPEPFHLKYLGIGNEDIISTVFEERYEMIARAVRAKYPDIKICGTVGPFHAPSADYQEGWDFTRRHPDLQYMVDEHYYESTGWFMHHRDYYDRYPRRHADGSEATKVYLGEWAASTKVKRPNVETALAEALYLTDIERNGDVVVMTSYAPMLAKDGHHNWNPDMIYFSNTDVRPTPAYDVQRLFSVHSGDTYLPSALTTDRPEWGYRLGASVVRDSKSGRTSIKLVNALPLEVTVGISGITVPATATTEGFCGQPEDRRVSIATGRGGQTMVLPPYSLTVVTY